MLKFQIWQSSSERLRKEKFKNREWCELTLKKSVAESIFNFFFQRNLRVQCLNPDPTVLIRFGSSFNYNILPSDQSSDLEAACQPKNRKIFTIKTSFCSEMSVMYAHLASISRFPWLLKVWFTWRRYSSGVVSSCVSEPLLVERTTASKIDQHQKYFWPILQKMSYEN